MWNAIPIGEIKRRIIFACFWDEDYAEETTDKKQLVLKMF